MSKRAEFHVRGQPLDGEPLHYTASGLDYVYLLNGFTVEEDPDYGRIVSIDNVDDLHRAIGLRILRKSQHLTGAEFRFLRKLMGLRQKDLAPEFGLDVQTVANYEKGKRIPATSDRLMRVLFVLWIAPPDMHAEIVKKLMEVCKEEPCDDQADICIVKQWQTARMDHHVH